MPEAIVMVVAEVVLPVMMASQSISGRAGPAQLSYFQLLLFDQRPSLASPVQWRGVAGVIVLA